MAWNEFQEMEHCLSFMCFSLLVDRKRALIRGQQAECHQDFVCCVKVNDRSSIQDVYLSSSHLSFVTGLESSTPRCLAALSQDSVTHSKHFLLSKERTKSGLCPLPVFLVAAPTARRRFTVIYLQGPFSCTAFCALYPVL